ncbi:hypothetical protein ACWKWJ_02990 [Sphingopyxis terrae subsp. ummariensis]
MRKPEIIVTDNEFAIVHAKATDAVSLDEVNEIIAYKIDELTADLVCCDIVTGSGDEQKIRTIHEEIPGFDALMARFETLPGFNSEWRDAVILPSFATNRTTIYNRPATAA